ncbi:helix-turn-helix domain-containing protein [Phenylobacterium sp. J367]|uniref:helix-turn-helix domain-containing protein n=1 Tax=Phenylobacterium sp. J367 TaxID=2898435 RepID=UPI00215078FE|nr:helix-turn-helix domain-containing protein [Phenylobacterium sp. J367]MCR5881041.1 helix-turn-helix domain-containing protein [Phenylobacterium sp. J367]
MVIRRTTIRAHGGEAALERAILQATRRELERAQAHLLLLGRKTAQEKVAAFLLAHAETQDEGRPVELPMGRQDIADYLGLTIETVSRMLTQLQAQEIVEFPSARRFRVRRWERLEELAD